MRRSHRSILVLVSLALPSVTVGTFAQVIVAPDGETRISFDGDGTGQPSDVRLIGYSQVSEMLWYEATTSSGMLSTRVENLYSPVSQTINASTASFVLQRNDGALQLDVLVRALNGNRASFDLTWTNIDTSGRSIEVLPFLYTDVDPDGISGGELLSYDGSEFEWFGGFAAVLKIGRSGEPYAGFEARHADELRDHLDAGRSTLFNDLFGAQDADWTAAVMGEALVLRHGETHSLGSDWYAFPLPSPGAWAVLSIGFLMGPRRRRQSM